jgi:hypothetical protein
LKVNAPVAAGSPGGNRSHTREDLERKENRVNLTLFGAHCISEFWKPLCDDLRIPQSVWLTREVILGTQRRPDFIINGLGQKQGCIEVELGGPENGQLQSYCKLEYEPVICIVGRRSGPDGPYSLEQVADLAKKVVENLSGKNCPAVAVLNLLTDTIDDALKEFRERSSVQPIPERLLALHWFATTIEPLLHLRQLGFVVNRTTSPQSLSLRLERVPCMRARSLALLTQRDAAAFLLPEPDEMDRVLGGPLADVTGAWKGLLGRIMSNWSVHKSENHRIRMDAQDFERNAKAFADFFAHLKGRVLNARL